MNPYFKIKSWNNLFMSCFLNSAESANCCTYLILEINLCSTFQKIFTGLWMAFMSCPHKWCLTILKHIPMLINFVYPCLPYNNEYHQLSTIIKICNNWKQGKIWTGPLDTWTIFWTTFLNLFFYHFLDHFVKGGGGRPSVVREELDAV